MKTNTLRVLTLVCALAAPSLIAGPLAAPPDIVAGPEPWRPGQPMSFLGGALVFDASYQGRFEFRENTFDFNSGVDSLTDDSFYLQRFRIGVKVRPASWLTIYAQGQDAREFGSKRPSIPGQLAAEGNDPFDLRQAYIELGDPAAFPVSLKLGRQVLSYGDQRLIGGFEWNNIARTFDAARLTYRADAFTLDLFTASVVVPDRDGFNQSTFTGASRDSVFSGIYASTGALEFQTTDLYALWLYEEGGTNFATLGTRWKSNKAAFGPWDYTLETAFQAGDVRGSDLLAFAGAVIAGYSFETAWSPRLFAGYSYGSGDGDPNDNRVNTFQNLYPTNHLFYGYMDTFSWQNIHNPHVGLELSPAPGFKLRFDYHMFWLATTSDAWYRANGVARVRPITPGASSFAGSEIDITAAYKATDYLSFLVGYSHFFAGDYLSDTGASSDADFVYVQVRLDF